MGEPWGPTDTPWVVEVRKDEIGSPWGDKWGWRTKLCGVTVDAHDRFSGTKSEAIGRAQAAIMSREVRAHLGPRYEAGWIAQPDVDTSVAYDGSDSDG